MAPQFVYDDIHASGLRGKLGKELKLAKLEPKADRLSCQRFMANQFRQLLYTEAYCLV